MDLPLVRHRKRPGRCIFASALALLILIVLFPAMISAGPFISINKIDITSEFPVVRIFITARNVDHSDLTGLGEENIFIYEDGFRVNYVKIMNSEYGKDLLYLVFSIDSSKSIKKSFFETIKKTAKEIILNARPDDRISIYRFNDEVLMLNNFTGNRAQLIENINRIDQHGTETLLFDSVYDSIDILSRVEALRKGIIVFTDGKDEGSSISSQDIVTFARDLDIPVYFICLKSSSNLKTLARISKLTGGKLIYSTNANDFANMYRTIVSAIKNEYAIQYKTMLKADGEQHRIEVRLKYGAIRDRDVKDIVFQRSIMDMEIPSLSEIILASLIIILIALLIVVLFSFLKRKDLVDKIYKPKKLPPAYAEYSASIDRAEKLRHEEDTVLTEKDPEYVYSKAWLLQKDGPAVGKRFPMFWDEVTIGRDNSNTIVVKDDAVSLQHAKIKRIKNAYYLFDLVSNNGTYLNGKKLLRPKPLYDWDEIKVGRTMFVFRGSKLA